MLRTDIKMLTTLCTDNVQFVAQEIVTYYVATKCMTTVSESYITQL